MINRVRRSKMKTKIKSFLKEISGNQLDQAKSTFPLMIATIDKTIRKGTIHKKTGARYKSRLSIRARKAGLQV